jgi:hypothetical protein
MVSVVPIAIGLLARDPGDSTHFTRFKFVVSGPRPAVWGQDLSATRVACAAKPFRGVGIGTGADGLKP